MGKELPPLVVENLPLVQLKPAPYNPRKISDAAFNKLATSIESLGLVDPLIVNKRTGYTVIGGHQRLKVLQAAGITSAPCVILDIEEDREKLLNVALNNQNMAGEYDFTLMADLLIDFDTRGLDTTLTGFSDHELEQIAGWTPDAKVGENGQAGASAKCQRCGGTGVVVKCDKCDGKPTNRK